MTETDPVTTGMLRRQTAIVWDRVDPLPGYPWSLEIEFSEFALHLQQFARDEYRLLRIDPTVQFRHCGEA